MKMSKRHCVRENSTPLIEVVKISAIQPSVSQKLKREEHVCCVELKHNLADFGNDIWAVHEEIDETWRNILNEIIINAADDDIITGYIENQDLARDIWIAPKRKCDLRFDEFLNAVGKLTTDCV